MDDSSEKNLRALEMIGKDILKKHRINEVEPTFDGYGWSQKKKKGDTKGRALNEFAARLSEEKRLRSENSAKNGISSYSLTDFSCHWSDHPTSTSFPLIVCLKFLFF